MKKHTCFALLAFFGAAALTPVMAATDAATDAPPAAPVEGAAPAAPHDGNKKHDGHGHGGHGHGHKNKGGQGNQGK